MIQLETERLRLRAFLLDDAEMMYPYAKDDRVGPSAGWAPHQSLEETRDVIRMFQADQDVWAMLRHGFIDLGLERIWCGHFDFNAQSRRVVEKCGFTYSFTTTQQLTRLDGRTVTSLVYVITRETYMNRLAPQ
ncbi:MULTISPECIES: GNAT family N-acetyltransferase [Exiguobacterium]|uniref:GNAT family N-acetyltransferase n=1 Tax=Exiguobacterium TaxID=33986 RepID=UPI001BE50192|nr:MULTISPECIES: GNAT family protein [Exiguobacterium]MCT4783953.1 GNAT family N-acetyltransferase [Exiguobacterium himgiriensis]